MSNITRRTLTLAAAAALGCAAAPAELYDSLPRCEEAAFAPVCYAGAAPVRVAPAGVDYILGVSYDHHSVEDPGNRPDTLVFEDASRSYRRTPTFTRTTTPIEPGLHLAYGKVGHFLVTSKLGKGRCVVRFTYSWETKLCQLKPYTPPNS